MKRKRPALFKGRQFETDLSAKRDAAAAKRFLQKALRSQGHPRPRVINVDGNPSYPKAITELNPQRAPFGGAEFAPKPSDPIALYYEIAIPFDTRAFE